MGFDVFDDLVAHEFDAPERQARHAQEMTKAAQAIEKSFGAFMRNARDREELRSRWTLVAEDVKNVFSWYRIGLADQKKIMKRLADSWENPSHESDNATTTKPEANPASSVPWGEAGPTPPQSGSEDKNDATLQHIANRRRRRRADTHEHYKGETPGQGGQGKGQGTGGFDPQNHPVDKYLKNNWGFSDPSTVMNSDHPNSTVGELSNQLKGNNMMPQSDDDDDVNYAVQSFLNTGDVRGEDNIKDTRGPAYDQMMGGQPDWSQDDLDMDAQGYQPEKERYSKKNKVADALQGVNPGDLVQVTQTTADGYSGQPIQQGSEWSVESINGSEAELYSPNGIDPGDGDNQSYVTVPVQVLEKVGNRRVAAWQWDGDSNSYKSSDTNSFPCSCGTRLTGVGQHTCRCGKVWNISSVLNGSKQATDRPSYSAREVSTNSHLVLADAKNNADGNNPAKGGPGPEGLEDPEQPDLVMESDQGSYVEPFNANGKGAKVLARILIADAGMWPMIGDKDLQANWKALMTIITDPTQVQVLEHQGFQGLIQELYEEINRRGLATPVDPGQVDQSGVPQPGQPSTSQPQQQPSQPGAPAAHQPDLVSPGQQMPSPKAVPQSKSIHSQYIRRGYNAAMVGRSPATDEPIETLVGYVLGLNKRLADSYTDRSTVFDGSKPKIPGIPIANDALDAEQNIPDPTPSQRSDTARDTDLVNTEGQSDDDVANHPEDFEPKGPKTVQSWTCNYPAIPV